MIKRLIILGAVICICMTTVSAQTVTVGSPVEDYYRRMQLVGRGDTNVSFNVRPIIAQGADSLNSISQFATGLSKWGSKNRKLKISALPLSVETQFNSHHPYGWNDGAMIPAKGMQLMISGGVFLEYGPLTIQLKPEILSAANRSFETLNKDHYDVFFARYYDVYNNIDLPARFGENVYNKAYLGQSSVRLNYKDLSFGLSSENLWWGPGIRNSLLMSNSAPGFLHLTLNTIRPIKTFLGYVEGQIIGGKLENSGFAPLTPDHYYFGDNLYVRKSKDWRYFSGIVFTWQPKWIPGIFVGFDKAVVSNGKDLKSVWDYLPLSSPLLSTTAPDRSLTQNINLSSVFIRWILKKEHAEVYFQWGQYNNHKNLTQTLLQANDSRAYTFGLRKLFNYNKSRGENILLNVETSVLQVNSIENLKSGNEWYVSKSIRQGYTNLGQSLGAGIGPGANIQSVDVSWVKGVKKIGLQFERYVHDNDFYFYAFYDSGDIRRHWVDLSLAGTGQWNFKNMLFSATISAVKSLNYQWYLLQKPGEPYYVNGTDVFNLHAKAGITYRF